MRFALLVLILVIAGCASVDPYVEAGVGKRIDEMSDWYLQDGRAWTCDGLIAELAAGVEREFSPSVVAYCELYHWSHYNCGSFNNSPELYELRLRCNARYRFGRRH